jgi:hypothetical protein
VLIWQFKLSSSTSSGATTSLFEGVGLLRYFLLFNQILDAFCPIIYFHDSQKFRLSPIETDFNSRT